MITVRVLLAALAAAFSVFALTLRAEPAGLAERAGLGLFVLFTVAWMIAVGERACMPRGGLRVRRFPLGPRLLQAKPALGAQMIVLIVALGCVTDLETAGWAALITAMVTIHAIRKLAVFAVPAAWVVHLLATMKEFHTLGDLVKDAGDTLTTLVVFALWAIVICGPLLRTDVASPLSGLGHVIAAVAALPMWAGACWLLSATPAATLAPDFLGFAFVLLAGAIVQSLILGAFNWAVDLEDRNAPAELQPSAYAVGMALLPLLAPLFAFVLLRHAPLPAESLFGSSQETWAGLMVVLLIVPAALGALMVGAGLDRLDGQRHGALGVTLAGAALLLWFLLGPIALDLLYAPGGPAAAVAAAFPGAGSGALLVAQRIPGGAPLSGAYGTELALFGLPATDLARALTLMVFGVAALSTRLLRHARPGQSPAGWAGLLGFLALSAAAAWVLLPRLGPVAAPLSFALASACLLAADLFHFEVRLRTPDEVAEEAAAAEEREVLRQREARDARAAAAATPREIVN